jgi:hypothetical protein
VVKERNGMIMIIVNGLIQEFMKMLSLLIIYLLIGLKINTIFRLVKWGK